MKKTPGRIQKSEVALVAGAGLDPATFGLCAERATAGTPSDVRNLLALSDYPI